MLLVLEGIDASGKSTLTAKLEKSGYQIYATPPREFRETRKKIDKFSSPGEQYDFYTRGVKKASDDLRFLLRRHKHVIVDRYWITTLVYHALKNVKVDPCDFDQILKPDFTLLLTVSYEEQQRRLKERGMSINDEEMHGRYHELLDTYKLFFYQLKENHEIIDTTNIEPSLLLKKVSKLL
ncbi:MAG: hypothetical protein Q8L11_01145 [Candidatus Moranbacteria bacterium]|nr:hypothetical protein [Candidatus Moranbacteria bacterium]